MNPMIRKPLTILSLLAVAATPVLAAPLAQTPPAKAPPPAKKPDTPKPKAGETKTADTGTKAFGVGSEADASISLPDLGGKTHTLKDYRGKVVVIEFWSMDAASAVYDKRLAGIADDVTKKGGVFLAIDASKTEGAADADPAKALQDYATKNGLHFPILVDKGGSVAHRLGAKSTTQVLVLDAKGIVRYSGAIDDDPKGDKGDKANHYLRTAVDAVMAGKDVTTATTPVTSGTPISHEAAKAKHDAPAGGTEKKDK